MTYLTSYAPIKDYDGTVSGVIMSGVDMTAVNKRINEIVTTIIIISVIAIILCNVLFTVLLRKRLKKPWENSCCRRSNRER